MKPYYSHAGITIYHGDCREILPQLGAAFLVTDPPYPNSSEHFHSSISAAREALSSWDGISALVFWSETERPPVKLPLVAVHIWHRTNVNGKVYEPIYHYEADGKKGEVKLDKQQRFSMEQAADAINISDIRRKRMNTSCHGWLKKSHPKSQLSTHSAEAAPP